MTEAQMTPEDVIERVLAGELDELCLWIDVPDGRYIAGGRVWVMDEHGMRAVEYDPEQDKDRYERKE